MRSLYPSFGPSVTGSSGAADVPSLCCEGTRLPLALRRGRGPECASPEFGWGSVSSPRCFQRGPPARRHGDFFTADTHPIYVAAYDADSEDARKTIGMPTVDVETTYPAANPPLEEIFQQK